MTIFGFYNPELEVNIKFQVLTVEQCQEFVARYKELPKNEYIYTVINMCVANSNSEVKPALGALNPVQADRTLMSLYNGCIMLNPILDIDNWGEILTSYDAFTKTFVQFDDEYHFFPPPPKLMPGMPDHADADDIPADRMRSKTKPEKVFSLSKAKLNTLPRFLKGKVIGQDTPIDLIFQSLRRHQVGLSDPNRPIGVFLFCGPSGVGKTYVAQELHDYLYDTNTPMVRIDCGEFQHKHENQKLVGSPPGYTGYEEGGFLFKALQESGGTVVLLDEVEKAHRDFFDTFLKAFDEGMITDSKGNKLDFRNSIFIMTSNLGNEIVSEETYSRQAGFTSQRLGDQYTSKETPKREMVERVTLEAVRKFFKPELINRVDDIIVFNHLAQQDYMKIADLEFQRIMKKLGTRSYNLTWSQGAANLLVERSARAMEGARSMAKERRSGVEDKLAELLLSSSWPKGKTFDVDAVDGQFVIK